MDSSLVVASFRSPRARQALPVHPPRTRSGLISAMVLLLCASVAQADTILLKDGSSILDCKVVQESETSISLQTPVGIMVVPRSQITSIQRIRTPLDEYKEQLSRIAEKDAAGLFKLALWCRGDTGLRKEADNLLNRVVDLDPDHSAARRLLGHIHAGGKWIVPQPLLIQLKIAESLGKNGPALREQLSTFLLSRKDVRLAPEGKVVDLRSGCRFTAAATISHKAGPSFYGKEQGAGQLTIAVALQSDAPWIGRTPLKTSVSGQMPSAAADATAQGLKNAIGGGSPTLHKYLDDLIQLRAKALLAELDRKPASGSAKVRKILP